MSLATMRPTFRLRLKANLSTVRETLPVVLSRAAWKDRAQLYGDYAEFHVAESEVRYWSPHLAVHLEPLDSNNSTADPGAEPGETLLLARFAPRQNVWMLVWIIYLAMAFVLFFATVYAGVQFWMKETPWALVFGFLSVGAIIALHLMSKIGQNWSADQMLELRQRLDDLLAEANIPTESIIPTATYPIS